MATRNWYCPHPGVAGDCFLTCRENSCSKPQGAVWPREAFGGPERTGAIIPTETISPLQAAERFDCLPPERTVRHRVDPATIEERNPLPVAQDCPPGVATSRSWPIDDLPEPGSPEAPHRRAGVELVATSEVAIVGMCVFKERLFVATSEGVFERLDDGAFHEVRLVKAEAQT